MAKVLVCDPMADGPMDAMRAVEHLDVTYSPDVSAEDLLTAVKGMHALVVRGRTKVTKEVIDACDEAKVVVRGGVGIDNIDHAYGDTKGIETKNTPAASSRSVAELALAMMFTLSRKLVASTSSMQAGKWEKKAFKGPELGGKTLGLIGLGRIAQSLGGLCHVLGMKVIGYDPYVSAADIKDFPVAGKTLDEVMAESDYISMHVPLTNETRHMVSTERLNMMKKTAYLVDCSRGGVRDDVALAQVLKDGGISGAGLDVFEKEPPESNPFEGMPNVVLAPHQGAQTAEGQSRVGFEVVEILREYFKP